MLLALCYNTMARGKTMKMKDKAEALLQEEEQAEKDGASFSKKVADIYQEFVNKGEHLSHKNHEYLKDILKQPIGYIDIDCYVQLMYMMGCFYDSEDNRNGARYCAMRLLWMKECYEKPRKRRPRYLDMHAFVFEQTTCSFITRYTDFLETTYHSIRQRLLMVSLLLLLGATLLLVLLVRIPVLFAVFEAAILCGLNYWIQMRRMPDMFQKNQTNAIEKYVEQELLAFDRTYRIA